MFSLICFSGFSIGTNYYCQSYYDTLPHQFIKHVKHNKYIIGHRIKKIILYYVYF